MESIDASIGQRIFDLRVERDVQQGELARAVGLHQSVLNRIEKGTRPAKAAEIRELALTFDVSADMLLCLTPLASQSDSPAATDTAAGATTATVGTPPSTTAQATAADYITIEVPVPTAPPAPVRPLFSTTESQLIAKFRQLDARGRDTVLRAIENELRYIAAASAFPTAASEGI